MNNNPLNLPPLPLPPEVAELQFGSREDWLMFKFIISDPIYVRP